MNLALFAQAKVMFDQIIDTSLTTYEWYSAYRGLDYGETTRMSWVRHFLYPTIPAIVSPGIHDDELVHPIRYGETTHQISTKLDYILDENLEPEVGLHTGEAMGIEIGDVVYTKLANIDYRIKRHDKLVCIATGEIFYVSDAHRSTQMTHTVGDLIFRSPPANDEM